jgi:hypothetical protein
VRKSVIIVDNFYRDPDAVRLYGLGQPMYFPYQRREEVRARPKKVSWYTTVFRSSAVCPFKQSLSLVQSIERAIGETIDIAHWNGDFPTDTEGMPDQSRQSEVTTALWNCCFHVKPKNDQPFGEGVHNHVTDSWNSVGQNGWSGLIYLNRDAPLRGGLRTWRNIDPRRSYDWMTAPENWQLIDDYANIFNRLILTRGDIPHSGAQGWGQTIESGRCFQTFFVKTVNTSWDEVNVRL